ncbi:hypothetical protein M8868_11485 [Pasteurella multocida]|uniref:hypothetical protein n=1 Tax=Pasteurella multocida TaxID=747 RepID=UPI001879B63C|nr:hypothetical protein [Pasteurella multocida]MBE7395126.1 hypothetical protein [Pasteurella multocida]MCL7761667.1 hypothetical protein [Pasteurella multocida]MCL7772534.1 hypothetical protein [Pasteurella multocida]MCL7774816.1 hypothetical protein [Pasteurella multocida]MCL7775907.1 hypothetical protein [Pasteurella multocida]
MKNNLLISYKWNDSPQNKELFVKQIQAFGDSIQIFESTWFVNTSSLPDEIIAKLKQLTVDSEIIICESRHCAWLLSEPAQSELKKFHKEMYQF